MTLSEKEFLKEYDIGSYERPSVAADIAVFTIQKKKEKDKRKDAEIKLNILLVQRGEHPFANSWALPGGFLKKGERIEECAFRNIKEKTGVDPVSLMPVDVFSEPDRDPRGWIISNAFAFVASEEQIEIVNGIRTAGAEWFEVELSPQENGLYELKLSFENTILSSILKEKESRFGKTNFEIKENNGLAFDHAKIIASAISLLRNESQNIQLLFDFLPEKFTLAALQKIQETLTGVPLIAPNFRRKIMEWVEETEEYTEGVRHRPAKLFKRKEKKK
jgi:ADP-ribose pyrophosphatase YjhB (NUDIX family)